MTDNDFTRLARDLGRLAGPEIVEAAQAALGTSAAAVADGWDQKLYREGHADKTGRRSVTFDVGVARTFHLWQTDILSGSDAATLVAEIGPRRGNHKQAGIVRLLENGSINNAPHGYGAGALQEHEAGYEAALDAAVHAVERKAGLG